MTPDYPRPLPPPRRRGTLTAVLAFTLFGVALVTPRLALEFSIASDWRHPSAALAYLALGGSPEACSALGYGAWMKRDYAQAELFSRALMEAEPDRASGPARLALTLVKQGRCSEARLALIEAERRLEHDRYPDPNTMDQARTVVGNCAP